MGLEKYLLPERFKGLNIHWGNINLKIPSEADLLIFEQNKEFCEIHYLKIVIYNPVSRGQLKYLSKQTFSLEDCDLLRTYLIKHSLPREHLLTPF